MKTFLLALVLALIAPFANAQPASAASAPDPTVCGALGVANQKHDASGRVVPCDLPCPPDDRPQAAGSPLPDPSVTSGPRRWTQGSHVCLTGGKYDTSPTSPSRNRTLAHGSLGIWQVQTGPMRGHLIEMCDNGVRSVWNATGVPSKLCAPATNCSVKWQDTKLGQTYVWPGRPAVPLNGTALAKSTTSNKTITIKCVKGDWVKA